MYRGFVPRVTKAKEISVKGYGTRTVKSDMVILAFNLISEAQDPYKAQQENEQFIQIFLDTLNEYGIKDEDIFYTSNELTPVYDANNEVIRYIASSIFKISFYDLEYLSEFLYNLRNIEVEVEDVLFTVKDSTKLWNETLADAVSNAYDRAKAVADRLGVKIEEVPQKVTEITDVNQVIEELQKHVIKEFASLAEGFTTNYSVVEAEFTIIEE
ncbi:SIMPL domain-containing protein [Vallitalea okinawensis]|uniref:SIMPL domain-containing protein n=1 Tax=Vallitalea okinawensis TaxID=2078660 RepID=UPI001FA93C29|nr:SIMPL domain-containing protein [Vallitalea okinawensis]